MLQLSTKEDVQQLHCWIGTPSIEIYSPLDTKKRAFIKHVISIYSSKNIQQCAHSTKRICGKTSSSASLFPVFTTHTFYLPALGHTTQDRRKTASIKINMEAENLIPPSMISRMRSRAETIYSNFKSRLETPAGAKLMRVAAVIMSVGIYYFDYIKDIVLGVLQMVEDTPEDVKLPRDSYLSSIKNKSECAIPRSPNLSHGFLTISATFFPPLINLANSILLCFFCQSNNCLRLFGENLLRVLKDFGKLLTWPFYLTYKFICFIKAKLQDDPSQQNAVDEELMDFQYDEAFFEAQTQLIYQITNLSTSLACGLYNFANSHIIIPLSYLTIIKTSISWHLHGEHTNLKRMAKLLPYFAVVTFAKSFISLFTRKQDASCRAVIAITWPREIAYMYVT